MNALELRRSLGNFVAITKSRLAGKSYVPHPRKNIFIETSGRCNLACRFCAYAKTTPGGFMTNENFSQTLEQVCELGFDFIWLTPMLGEAFADPHISDKFDHLEDISQIHGYSFYSNFILARPQQIRAFNQLDKLTSIFISLYGYDVNSFIKTTRKPASQFLKLQDNLKLLIELSRDWQPRDGLHFNVRTEASKTLILERDTPQSDLLRQLVKKGAHLSEATEYDTWGGTITKSDVESLGIDLVDGNNLYMHGACTKVFSEIQIKADRQVHACACRDMDGSLIIGDLKQDKLSHILSFENTVYKNLISAQMQGSFGSNCKSCSSYRSVLDGRAASQDAHLTTISYDQACHLLNE